MGPIGAVLAFFIDSLIGDPRSSLHPVVIMGKFIGLLERLFRKEKDSPKIQIVKGALLVLLVLAISWSVTYGLLMIAGKFSNIFEDVLGILLLSFFICPRSLAEAGFELRGLLEKGDLPEARRKVGWIVGRDTDSLDEAEITRATVETIAENTVDGIIAPLFFYFIGGVPMAALYRAANTMDSMLGYKNEKYLYFGKVAARTDDVLNIIPARITGILTVISAMAMNYNWKNSFKIMLRDASGHPSPNGGYPEASTAGALNIRLGGFNYYFGKKSFRAYMGDNIEALTREKIYGAIMLMYVNTVLFIAIAWLVCLEV